MIFEILDLKEIMIFRSESNTYNTHCLESVLFLVVRFVQVILCSHNLLPINNWHEVVSTLPKLCQRMEMLYVNLQIDDNIFFKLQPLNYGCDSITCS